MQIEAFRGSLWDSRMDTICLFIFQEGYHAVEVLGENVSVKLKESIDRSYFKGKKSDVFKLPSYGDLQKDIYVIGLGESSKVSLEVYRSVAGDTARELRKNKVNQALVILPEDPDENTSRAMAEGFELGSYAFRKYKKEEEGEPRPELERIEIFQGNDLGIETGKVLACSQNLARDLANEPGNVINPSSLALHADQIARDMGLKCDIWDENKIQEEGMLALWHVGKGSSIPPRFIHLSYVPEGDNARKFVFVGKGITFDSGGLNIKPGEHMRDMKGDKTGACDVLGIMRGVARLRLPFEVHGLIGAAENMPGGNSYRPDDIIRARNGITIEIDNTDAEGRVTLADSLSFASELEPEMIIDLATLTGACVVALGNYTAGLFSPDDAAASKVMQASRTSGERFWRLPMDDEKLREQLKSSYADILNTGGRGGGAITAAMFLREFVKEGIPWVHLDIAGVDNYKKPFWYYPEGATGFGVRTCLQFLMDQVS
ncbi:MAG: leucyl aminopeptidase [Synergistales bacterium]|nr:leucyl aminopeptidase [Synergistales bacterium]